MDEIFQRTDGKWVFKHKCTRNETVTSGPYETEKDAKVALRLHKVNPHGY
jgi:hypothetical protein